MRTASHPRKALTSLEVLRSSVCSSSLVGSASGQDTGAQLGSYLHCPIAECSGRPEGWHLALKRDYQLEVRTAPNSQLWPILWLCLLFAEACIQARTQIVSVELDEFSQSKNFRASRPRLQERTLSVPCSQKTSSCPLLSSDSPLPTPHKSSPYCVFCYHGPVLPLSILFIDGIVQYKLFSVQLLFFTIFGRVILFVVCSSVSFSLCCIVSYHMNILQLIYPFYCSWTFRQFLVFAIPRDMAMNILVRLQIVFFSNIINLTWRGSF